MKITTWNVNGLRALLNKNAWDWVQSYGPDVVCLQETKARPDQLTEKQHAAFEGYTPTWNPAERPGYSGVLTLAKDGSAQSELGFGIEKFDIEGRVVQTKFDGFRLN